MDDSEWVGVSGKASAMKDGKPEKEITGEPLSDDDNSLGNLKEVVEEPSGWCHRLANIIPAGGALSAGINLASTSIGAGIVGMPAGFSMVGLVIAILYLIAVTVETAYSMALLAEVSKRTGLRSYEEMARHLLHRKGHVAVAFIRVLHTLGGTVVYVVTIRDLVTPILKAMNDPPEFALSAVGLRVIQAILFLIFMLPLVIPRFINAMRYVSAVAIVFIIYLSVIVVVESCTNGLRANPRPSITMAAGGNTALEGVGVFIFSFMCQINCVEIFYEMKGDGPVKKFTVSSWISMTMCGFLYLIVGLFGYLDFGDALSGSILLQYNPIKQPAILVCYVGVFIKICASFSLVSFAQRSAFFPLLGWDPATVEFHKHLIGSISLALFSLVLGVFVPDINTALSFFGGVCGGSIGFILPALFYMYAGDWSLSTVGIVNYICTYLMLIVGVIAVVLGTIPPIYDVAS